MRLEMLGTKEAPILRITIDNDFADNMNTLVLNKNDKNIYDVLSLTNINGEHNNSLKFKNQEPQMKINTNELATLFTSFLKNNLL